MKRLLYVFTLLCAVLLAACQDDTEGMKDGASDADDSNHKGKPTPQELIDSIATRRRNQQCN